MRQPTDQAHTWLWVVCLFLLCLTFFSAMTYGGIRTPDGEIVFRVGNALARHGSFAVDEQLPSWKGFALARGIDGRIYSAFAPAQSILSAPLIKAGLWLDRTGWYETVPLPVSFNVDTEAIKAFVYGYDPGAHEQHALRAVASVFNLLMSSLLAVVFFVLLRKMAISRMAAFAVSLLLALATPLWSYSGTMFKEPLTMIGVLLSFYCLVANDANFTGRAPLFRRTFLAGVMAGTALASHITAILFAPFLFIYALYPYGKRSGLSFKDAGIRPAIREPSKFSAGLVFVSGVSMLAGLLAAYNYSRFGSILETGRSEALEISIRYGVWVAPWEGLMGFIASPGKGLFWFAPIVIAGLWCWPLMGRRHRFLSILIIVMIVFRTVFLSCRSDWHGGFCLGPRHLLPVIPFLLMPLGYKLDALFRQPIQVVWKKSAALLTFFWACLCQQIYFCLGEPISFYYIMKHFFLSRGVSIISDNRLYFQWDKTPLFYLLEGKRGPWLLQNVSFGNYQLWIIMAGMAGVIMFFLWRYWLMTARKLSVDFAE